MAEPLYLDHAATTPVRDEVRESMAPLLSSAFGNPSSLHRWGREARAALEGARRLTATVLGVRPSQIYFVRGGTEADNLAILGRARKIRISGAQPRIITSAVEHPAVFEAAQQVLDAGGEHDLIPTFGESPVDLEALATMVESGASLASAIWVNNEVGLVLPIAEIVEICHAHDIPVHSDAVQAVGKIPVDLLASGLDYLTATGHKIYGPMGTGMLFAKNPATLAPLVFGGGQEQGLRPGTEDVAGAVGFARALELAVLEQPEEHGRTGKMQSQLEKELSTILPELRVRGQDQPRAPHISCLSLPELRGETLLARLDLAGLALSGGSACSSGSNKPSRVLTSLYGDSDDATLRISLGHLVQADDVPRVIETLVQIAVKLGAATTGSPSVAE